VNSAFKNIGLTAICIAAAVGFATSPAGAKSSCKKKHEKKGCAVAHKFAYVYSRHTQKTALDLGVAYSKTSAFTVTLGRNAYLPCSSGSAAPGSYSLAGDAVTIKKKARIGKTYKGTKVDNGTRLTVKLKVKVKFTSAKHASVKFAYTETQPGSATAVACAVTKTVTLKRTA
jgi:hypothetical protein